MWAQWGPCPPHCHGSGHGKARGPLLGPGQGPALSPPSLPLTHVESPRSPGGGQGHLGFACGARTRDRGDTCVQGRGQQTGSVASPVPSHKLRLCFHGKWCGRPQGSRTNSPCLADGAGSGPDSAQLCPRGWQGRGPAGPGAPCQLPGSPGWASRGSLLGGKEGSPGTSVSHPPAWQPRSIHEPCDNAGDSPSLLAATVCGEQQATKQHVRCSRTPWALARDSLAGGRH